MQSLLKQPQTTRPVSPPTASGIPVYVRSTAEPSAAYVTTKRLLDVAVSLACLVILSPLFLIVALCIKFTDGGPVFFRQKRVGLNGRVFDFIKFRSMIVDAEDRQAELLKLNKHRNSITFKMCRDPRVTWVGRIMRKTSIDEIHGLMKAAAGGELRGILAYSDGPLVSVDFNHDAASSTYDATLTKVIDGTLVKVCAWYDNEWGFSNRMLDTTVAWSKAT